MAAVGVPLADACRAFEQRPEAAQARVEPLDLPAQPRGLHQLGEDRAAVVDDGRIGRRAAEQVDEVARDERRLGLPDADLEAEGDEVAQEEVVHERRRIPRRAGYGRVAEGVGEEASRHAAREGQRDREPRRLEVDAGDRLRVEEIGDERGLLGGRCGTVGHGGEGSGVPFLTPDGGSRGIKVTSGQAGSSGGGSGSLRGLGPVARRAAPALDVNLPVPAAEPPPAQPGRHD